MGTGGGMSHDAQEALAIATIAAVLMAGVVALASVVRGCATEINRENNAAILKCLSVGQNASDCRRATQ